jgi:hypothetical protein
MTVDPEKQTSQKRQYYSENGKINFIFFHKAGMKHTKSLYDTFVEFLQTPLCDAAVAKSTVM